MKSSNLKLGCALVSGVLSVLAVFACSSRATLHEDAQSQGEVGSLELLLSTSDETQYRLRAAELEITNHHSGAALVISSEDDVDSELLTVELATGNYQVLLRDGWYVEQLTDDGAKPINAVLTTPNPVEARVDNDAVTPLTFSFVTPFGSVTFGAGQVAVTVGIAENDALQACDLLVTASCPSGQTCLLATDGGHTFCGTAGTLPIGSACDSEQCGVGAQCLDVEGAGQAVCTAFCDPTRFKRNCECRPLDLDANVGVCVAGAPEPACDLSNPESCGEAEVCQDLGDGFGVCGPRVRLVGGAQENEGRVEVFYNGVWGTVCDDGFSDRGARVACSQLGYEYGRFLGNISQGGGTIWLDDVYCYGDEASLFDCNHMPVGWHNCSHYEDVSVRCE